MVEETEIADEPTTEREGRGGSRPGAPIEAVGLTNQGRVRQRNEDAFDIVADIGLAMVADGLGGHPAGDIASRMAVQEVADRMRDLDPDPTQPNLCLHCIAAAVSTGVAFWPQTVNIPHEASAYVAVAHVSPFVPVAPVHRLERPPKTASL